jgi:hypothetical protein
VSNNHLQALRSLRDHFPRRNGCDDCIGRVMPLSIRGESEIDSARYCARCGRDLLADHAAVCAHGEVPIYRIGLVDQEPA